MSAPRTDAGRALHEAVHVTEAVAKYREAVRARVTELLTHEAGANAYGPGIDWLCVPDPDAPEGRSWSVDCGDNAAHHRLIDRAAVIAILDEPLP